MKKSSIIVFAFVLFTFASSVFGQDETRVSSAVWRVLRYDINAALPQAATDRSLSAKATLTLQNISSNAASRLTLRISDKAEVLGVKVNNAAGTFSIGKEEKLGATRNLQRVVVNLPGIQPNANATVSVDYKLKVDENSGVAALSPVGSQFLPLGFWYPTPNNQFATYGADFAPFSLTVTAQNGETVIASGKANGTAFNQTLNAQPFFITGNWDAIETGGVTVYLPKGAATEERKRADELAVITAAARTYLSNLLGTTPDVPLKIVAVRRAPGFSDGGTLFLDYAAFRRQKVDSQTALTIADSMAKMFLGNAIAVRGERYGIIREGLSRFIATQFIEKQFGKEAADVERLRQRTAYSAIVARDAPLGAALPLDDFYYTAMSNKGAMVWRLLAKNLGEQEVFNVLREQLRSGTLTVANLRAAFTSQKVFLDYAIDQPTDMNLLAGLPQASGAETKVALRNLGSVDAAVNVVGTTDKGEKLIVQTTIPAKSFGEASFKTVSKLTRVEIDPEKFYPQIDFSDDIAPREFKESDAILVIKRAFDKQDFAAAEKNARAVLQIYPRFDDARTWLGRALLAQGKTAEAEREFRAVLDEKLPTARSLAWANVGLGEIALKSNQSAQAASFFNEAIKANAEYASTFNARAGRNKLQANAAVDESVRAFFQQFDKAATSGRKADLDVLVMSGEIPKFSSGIGGQAQIWETRLVQVDRIDTNNVLAEVSLNIKLLNKNPESGTAIFQLSKSGSDWKLSAVEIFEVR